MWQLQLKRQKSLAFCLLHKYSSYLKTLLPLQLEHCWFFFNNKHILYDEVLHNRWQVQHPRWLHLLSQQTKLLITVWFYKQSQHHNRPEKWSIAGTCIQSNNTVCVPSSGDSSATWGHLWGTSTGRVRCNHVSWVLSVTLLSLTWSQKTSPCSSGSVPVCSG